MSTLRPRRSFTAPLVITMAGAASLVGCGGKSEKVLPTGPNPPSQPEPQPQPDVEPQPDPQPDDTTAAPDERWQIRSADGGKCVATACAPGDVICRVGDPIPVPCVKGNIDFYVFRMAGETACKYDGYKQPACDPRATCNPPAQTEAEWVAIACPDGK